MVELAAVFVELRKIMAPYAAKLNATKDDELELYVDTRHIQKNKKPLLFGAIQVKKSYVSYHLMPVYLKPELLVQCAALFCTYPAAAAKAALARVTLAKMSVALAVQMNGFGSML